MATELYSLTHSDVSAEMGYPAFSTATTPSSTTVTTWLSQIAGEVNGLAVEHGYTLADIAADDEASGWFKYTILLGVAARVSSALWGELEMERARVRFAEYQRRKELLQSDEATVGSQRSGSSGTGSVRQQSATAPYDGLLIDIPWSAAEKNRTKMF